MTSGNGVVFFLLTLAVTSIAAAAQSSDSWLSLQGLRPGDRIGIVKADMKRVEGRFGGANDAGITVRGDTEITVPKDDVVRVYEVPRVNRLGRTLIGAGVGVAAGVILDSTVGTRFRNEGQDTAAGIYAGAIGAGTAIGALSGGGYKTVYQRTAPLTTPK